MILDFSGALRAADKFKSLEYRDLTIRGMVFKRRLERRDNGREVLRLAFPASPESG
jgi:hypothetical protein